MARSKEQRLQDVRNAAAGVDHFAHLLDLANGRLDKALVRGRVNGLSLRELALAAGTSDVTVLNRTRDHVETR